MSGTSPKADEFRWGPPVVAFCFVVAAWICNLLLPYWAKNPGQFGDMFGAVNALFSGLALGGIVLAILLQREDLKLQRTELELTRKELAGQKEALTLQNDTLRLEGFENTFFQLLRLQTEIANSIDLVNPANGNRTQGRDCFRIFSSRLRSAFEKKRLGSDRDELQAINSAYRNFFVENQGNVGHYFRSLYNLIKFVDRSAIVEKEIYTNLVRSQLSSYELLLLFYNCLSDLGRQKFKPLVERYALLKTVPRDELLDASHTNLYEPSAFLKSA